MNRQKSDNTMKAEPIDVGYRQHVMGWGKDQVWDNINKNKEHQGNKFGKKDEFTLNLKNQVEVRIKQFEKPEFKGRREIKNRDLRIIQTEGSETMSKDQRCMKNDLKSETWRTLTLMRKKEEQKVKKGKE